MHGHDLTRKGDEVQAASAGRGDLVALRPGGLGKSLQTRHDTCARVQGCGLAERRGS